MTRGEYITLAAFLFAVFAALLGMLLTMVKDAHQITWRNSEAILKLKREILKLEKEIMELRYAKPPEDSEPSRTNNRPRRENDRPPCDSDRPSGNIDRPRRSPRQRRVH